MSTFEAAIGQLPEPILDKLQSMIRRVRRLLFIRGFFATLAVALVCLLTIMAIDAAFTLFSNTARWALSLTGLAITLCAAWWFLVRPLSRKFTLTHMARILEIRHPELQERISTAVELMSSDDPDSIKGSEELIEAVVDSAVVDVEAVDPNTEFKPAKAAKFIRIAITCLALLLITLAIWPRQSWTLLSRALAPFLDIGNAYADTLVIDPGDIRVARGEPVTIEVSIQQKRLKRAEVRRKLEDGTETVERMSLIGEDEDGTKRFTLTFPSVAESFDYRVRAGSAVSEYFDVDAVEPPSISGLTIRYDYPDYTGKESSENPTETGEIRAVAHTRVTVEASLNRAPWTAKLFLNEAREMGTPEITDNLATWEFELLSGMSGNWRIELADEEGFENEPSNYPIEVLPDKAPIVQITQPTQREFKLRPTETLPLEASVTEDFGIGDFSLLVTPQGDPSPTIIPQSTPKPTARDGSYFGSAKLNLASLNLRPDQKKLSVQLRAQDNRPADYDGPGVGLSETILITIDRNAKSLADQAIEKQKKEIEQTIREARQELERARDDINRTEQELRRSDDVTQQAREKLDQFSEHTDAAREKLDELTAALDNSLFQKQADQAETLSKEKLAKARETADLIPISDEKEQRVADARSAKKEVEESIRELDQLAREMREADEDYRAISEINQLANKQQELAQKAEQFAEEAQKKAAEMQAQQASEKAQQQFDQQQQRELNQFRSEQKQVEQKLGQMLKDNAAALAEVLEDQREQASELAQEAAALAEQQEQLKEANEETLRSKAEDQEAALKEQLLAQLETMQKQVAEDTALAQQQSSQDSSTPTETSSAENEAPETASPEASPNRETAQNQANEDAPQSPQTSDSEAQPSASETSEQNKMAEQNSASDPSSGSSGEDSEPQTESGESESSMASTEALDSAAEQTEQAAQELSDRNLDAASEAAAEAGVSLAEAAQSEASSESSASEEADAMENETTDTSPSDLAGNEEPTDAPGKTESATGSEMAELAEKQQAIAEQIAAVRDGKLQEALAMMEAMMNEEASALQSEAQAFERAMQSLQQNSARSASDQAEQSLARGAQEAQNAARGLDQAQQQQTGAEEQGRVEEGQIAKDAKQSMQRSLSDQQQSQAQFNRAAEMLSQASQSIGQTLEGLEPSDMDDRITNSEDLAEGFNEVSEASDAQSAQQAAQEAQEAASSLQQLAQQAMQKLGNGQQGNQPTDPNQQGMPQPNQDLAGEPQSTNLNETGEKKADLNGNGVPPELLELGISAEDWARFKGALVGGNATAIETELPAEYRELVGRYFQVIAKEAGN